MRQLAGAGFLPSEVVVRSPLLAGLLEIVASDLGFKVTGSIELPALDAARGELENFLRR